MKRKMCQKEVKACCSIGLILLAIMALSVKAQDFDGDGFPDYTVYNDLTGNWYVQTSQGESSVMNWGFPGTTAVPGDYNGIGSFQLAVYHKETGMWYILNPDCTMSSVQFGWSEAVPVPNDYDQDGRTDVAVYHAPTGKWYVLRSSDFQMEVMDWGFNEAAPVVATMLTSVYDPTQTYSYFFKTLPAFDPLTPLEDNEMRITFMGSMIPLPVRRAQAEMSIFVEVGWSNDVNDRIYGGRARDQLIFDMGAGVSANYAAAMVGYRRMDKVFINHLHGDHMSDLLHTYCFGPSADRKSPLYVWGSKASGVESPPGSGIYYDDGVSNFCANLRRALRWHSESFSFQPTSYEGYVPPTKESWGLPQNPVPVENDPADDAYAMVPIELDWSKVGGVAYSNADTGITVTHFPVIHARKGSMGYKLKWQIPGSSDSLTMIYTSDTKPETNCIDQAINGGAGVDVFIHEMVVPPSVWAYKNMGLNEPPATNSPLYPEYANTVASLMAVQNSSHTTPGAFGYILSQITPKPRLAVATHFPVADDTVASALKSVQGHTNVVMGTDIIWSFDLLVLRVFPDRIEQCRAEVSDYAFNPPFQKPSGKMLLPKYNDGTSGNPYSQIDLSSHIPAVDPDTGKENYREDGF